MMFCTVWMCFICFIRYLHFCVTEPLNFFETLEDNVKNDYKLLCYSFKTRFLPKELNLFQVRQNETQTVGDFASEITKLAARAYGDMDRNQNDGLIREH